MNLDAVRSIVASAAGTQAATLSAAEARRAPGGRVARGAAGQLDAENIAARDRDADGRLGWQIGRANPDVQEQDPAPAEDAAVRGSETRGNSLDVTG